MIKSRITFSNYCLPVSLAMHLRGISGAKLHQEAHKILFELGYLTQLKKDYQVTLQDLFSRATKI